MHGPQFLIDYDLIIVTVNYRLGPLGQLSLDTGLVSGNQVTFTRHHPDIRHSLLSPGAAGPESGAALGPGEHPPAGGRQGQGDHRGGERRQLVSGQGWDNVMMMNTSGL